MSTYENPITAIDRGLGDLIANSVKSSSAKFAQLLEKQENNRVEQLKKARLIQDNIDKAHTTYRAQFHSEALKSGAQSKSYFQQMDRAINEKFRLMKVLATATDPDERQELSNAIQHYSDQITVGTQTAENLSTWKKGEGAMLTGLKNEIGGIYTGIYDEESDDEFAKRVGRGYFLKLALSGMAVRDGKPAGNPIFFMKNVEGIPTQYAYLESEGIENAFNVNEVMQEPLAEIMDMDKTVTEQGANGKRQTFKGFEGIFKDTGIMANQFQVSQPYLMTDEEGLPIVAGATKKLKDGRIQTNLVQLANIPKMIEAAGPAFQNFINAKTETVENFQDYADVNSTYLEYASKLTPEQLKAIGIDKVENLTHDKVTYKLTPEAKENFEKVLLNYSLSKYIKGYQPIATQETDTKGEFKYIDPNTQEEKIITYHYDKDQYKSVGNTNITTPETTKPEFNESTTRKINNTVNKFKNANNYDFLVGINIPNLGVVSNVTFDKGKLTLDKDIGKPGEDQKIASITGYENIDIKGAKLRTLVRAYVKRAYGYGDSAESRKVVDRIMQEIQASSTTTSGSREDLPRNNITTFNNNPAIKK